MKNTPISLKILGFLLFPLGLFAFFGSVFLWGQGFILAPPPDVDLGFPITDILINAPASILAGFGLLRLRKWGQKMAWFVAGFYIYASVEIFVHMFQAGPPLPPEIYIPQTFAVLIAIALLVFSSRHEGKYK